MRNRKFKLVIGSGKGGAGKSMLTSALAMLFAKDKKIVAVDCDVDAPNLAIWLNEINENPKNPKPYKISTSEKPIIDNSKIKENPERFAKKCRFGALEVEKGKLKVNPFLCEGCGACEIFCPLGAITMSPVKNGEIRVRKTKYGFDLVTGQLFPGETGSGKVVAEIRKKADEFEYDIMIIDSAPGTGCPVIASLQGADFAVLVTEPTPSGFSDLKRVLEVVNHFKIPYNIVINKWDINPDLSKEIENWAKSKFLGKISYDKKIFKSIAQLTPILETNLKAKREIKRIFNRFKFRPKKVIHN